MTTPQQPGQQPGAARQPFGQQPYGPGPATGPQPFASPQQYGQQPPGSFGQPGGQGAFTAAGGAPTGGPMAGGAAQGYQGPGFPAPNQPSTFGPAQGAGGFGPAMPPIGRRRGRPGWRKVRYIRLGISAIVIVIALVSWLVTRHSDPATAQVGDCMGSLPAANSNTPVTVNDAKKVDCTDPSAQYKVLGRKDNTSMDTFNNESSEQLCGDFPSTTKILEVSNSNSDSSSDGTLFCLADVKH